MCVYILYTCLGKLGDICFLEFMSIVKIHYLSCTWKITYMLGTVSFIISLQT